MMEYALSRMLVVFPAFLVVGLVELIRSRAPDRGRAFERILTLAIGLGLVVGVTSVLLAFTWGWSTGITDRLCNNSRVTTAIGQAACFRVLNYWRLALAPGQWIYAGFGLLGALSLFWPGRAAIPRRAGVLIAVLAALLLALPPLVTGGRPSLLILAVLVPAAYIPLVWHSAVRGGWGWAVLGVGFTGLAFAGWAYLYRYPAIFTDAARPLTLFGQMLLFMLLPLTAGLLAARVVGTALHPRGESPAQVVVLALLVILMLAWTAYVTFNETIWDNIMDGSTAIMITGLAGLGVVAGAMLLGWTLPGGRKPAALGFAIIMLALINLPAVGIRHPGGLEVSTTRGLRIGQAVENYRARTGQYPASLGELFPRDLLYAAPPVSIRELGWCYQSGADFYRLGYVFRPVMGVPPEYYEVRTVRSAGPLPEGAWECEAELARQKEEASRRYMGP